MSLVTLRLNSFQIIHLQKDGIKDRVVPYVGHNLILLVLSWDLGTTQRIIRTTPNQRLLVSRLMVSLD